MPACGRLRHRYERRSRTREPAQYGLRPGPSSRSGSSATSTRAPPRWPRRCSRTPSPPTRPRNGWPSRSASSSASGADAGPDGALRGGPRRGPVANEAAARVSASRRQGRVLGRHLNHSSGRPAVASRELYWTSSVDGLSPLCARHAAAVVVSSRVAAVPLLPATGRAPTATCAVSTRSTQHAHVINEVTPRPHRSP